MKTKCDPHFSVKSCEHLRICTMESIPTVEESSMFTGVSVVLKSVPHLKLPAETVLMVSEYLRNTSVWKLESATTAGYAHLLSVLAPRQWSGVPEKFRLLRRQWGVKQAAIFGHVQALQWWVSSYLKASQRNSLDSRALFVIAVENGRANVLQWLEDYELLPGLLSDYSIIMRTDDANVVYWLHDHTYTAPFTISCAKAVKAGDFAFIQWVYNHYRDRLNAPETAYWAARCGFDAIVRWLHEMKPHCVVLSEAMRGAIVGGHLEIIQWIHSTEPTPIQEHGPVAVNVPMIQWLLQNCEWTDASSRFKWVDTAIVCAIEAGDFEAIDLLHRFRQLSQFPYNRIDAAARIGDLEMLQWLYEFMGNSCNVSAMDYATAGGHLEVVMWLHQTWPEMLDASAVSSAIENGHLHILQYVDAHLDRSAWLSFNEMRLVASCGHLPIIQWLDENEFDLFVDVDDVAANGHLGVLQYLENEYALMCSKFGATRAAAKGHFELLEWTIKKDMRLAEGLSAPICEL